MAQELPIMHRLQDKTATQRIPYDRAEAHSHALLLLGESRALSVTSTFDAHGISSAIAFHAIMLDGGCTLFTASSLSRGAGLGFTSREIAISLSLMGFVIFVTQLSTYPMLNCHIGTLDLWRLSGMIFALVHPLFSLLPAISSGIGRWATLLALLSVRFSMAVVGYTHLNILVMTVLRLHFELLLIIQQIDNTVDASRRGFVNGYVLLLFTCGFSCVC